MIHPASLRSDAKMVKNVPSEGFHVSSYTRIRLK